MRSEIFTLLFGDFLKAMIWFIFGAGACLSQPADFNNLLKAPDAKEIVRFFLV
jgi:hypothetical protein